MTVFILGGGPAGLAVADGLHDLGVEQFFLFEKSDSLGGLAKTLEWDAVGYHDLGPHRLFTLDRKLMERVKNLLSPQDWLINKKNCGIFINGKLLNYPPNIFNLINAFGTLGSAKLFVGYVTIQIQNLFLKPKPKNFEDCLISKVGKPLYNSFFKPAASKVWGDLKLVEAKLAGNRIQIPSLYEFLLKQLGMKKTNPFEVLNFHYPKGGMQKIWDSIKQKVNDKHTIKTNHSITKIEISNDRITKITCKNSKDNSSADFEVKDNDQVVSTLPLALLATLIPSVLSDEDQSLIRKYVVLNDLNLVFFHIGENELFSKSWIYVPDLSIVFHRVSEQKSFDPNMTPHGSIVCCEIMCHANNDIANLSEVSLVELALKDLRKMTQKKFNVLATRVIKLPQSYPTYLTGYEKYLSRILDKFDAIKNLKTIGRNGSFNYIGTLDAMDIGYGYVNWLIKNTSKWEAERLRTSNYSILD